MAEMDMVEIVARAIAKTAWERMNARDSSFAKMKYPSGVSQYCDEQWPIYRKDARAAVEAMRIPTQMMIDGADNKVTPDSDNLQCPDWYTAAIDAALSSSTSTRE